MSSRIEALKKVLPGSSENKEVMYRTIRQVEFTDKEDAESLFHGVVVTHKPKMTAKKEREERGAFDRLVKVGSVVISTGSGWYRKREVNKVSSENLLGSFIEDELELLSSKPVTVSNGSSAESIRTITRRARPRVFQADSTFVNVMNRNEFFENAIFVTDLTGSMYPYSAQVLRWIQKKENRKKVSRFVFFNDGNRKPNHRKEIGKTGGVYVQNAKEYKPILAKAKLTMSKGSGGDKAENNIEAILKGIETYPSCSEIVMIEDNWAPVKDMTLLKQIKKPVHVIVCGVYKYIHTDYLNIAYATGGTLHAIDDDVIDFTSLKDGETIKIIGVNYRLKNGKFLRVESEKS